MMEKGAELLGGKSRAAPNGAKSSSPSNGHYSEPESGGGDSGDEHGASLGPPRRRRQGGGGGGGRGGEPSRAASSLPVPGLRRSVRAAAEPRPRVCGAGSGSARRGPAAAPAVLNDGEGVSPGSRRRPHCSVGINSPFRLLLPPPRRSSGLNPRRRRWAGGWRGEEVAYSARPRRGLRQPARPPHGGSLGRRLGTLQPLISLPSFALQM